MCRALTPANDPIRRVVAVNGELAPLITQPAVSATTKAVGSTPRLAALGINGAINVTIKIGFIPSCPANGIIQTNDTKISHVGNDDRSNPAPIIIGANNCDPTVPIYPAIMSKISSPR